MNDKSVTVYLTGSLCHVLVNVTLIQGVCTECTCIAHNNTCVDSLCLRQQSVLGSTNAWDCQAEHHKEPGYHALPYQTVELG